MDMIFTGKTDWQLFLDFFCHELMLGIEVDGYSHEFWKSMKRMEWRKTMNELGLLFWDLGWTDFEGYGKCDTAIEFYIWEYENTPQPLSRGEL
jgi:hypothetical protein